MDTMMLARRRFLAVGGASAAGLATGALSGTRSKDSSKRVEHRPGPAPDGLFRLGVASGDPLPDGVVVWTRLAPDPLALDGHGGMPNRQVPVRWEVAADERFRQVVRRGVVNADPRHAHAVHVDVEGLQPARWYYYRFTARAERSQVGRTRTAPAPGDEAGGLVFALASCQNYPTGYYTAYQHMLREDLDLVVHVGDYIYEGGTQGNLGRGHVPAREIRDLADYRVRHAQYKTDRDLQAMNAAAPVVVTFDDHEVENNWADGDADPDKPHDQFQRRKAAAFRAYWEHMPLRRAQRPVGTSMRLYRRLNWGGLAVFNVLDTRQYRSDQVNCADADCADAFDSSRTMLGDTQEQWLLNGLANSGAPWNVLTQQVPMFEDPMVGLEADKWDGYRVARQHILDQLASGDVAGPVVLSGDIHANRAADLKADFQDPDSATVGSEFAGTSVSSFGDTATTTNFGPFPDNPHIKFSGHGRGYLLCRVTPDHWRTDYRVVDTVEQPSADVGTVASFAVEAGRPGLRQA